MNTIKNEFAEKIAAYLNERASQDGFKDTWRNLENKNAQIVITQAYRCVNERDWYEGYAIFSLTFNTRLPIQIMLEGFKLKFHGQQSHDKARRYMLRDYIDKTVYEALKAFYQTLTP